VARHGFNDRAWLLGAFLLAGTEVWCVPNCRLACACVQPCQPIHRLCTLCAPFPRSLETNKLRMQWLCVCCAYSLC